MKYKATLAAATLLALTLLLAGCGAKRLYDGPALPRDQVATIIGTASAKAVARRTVRAEAPAAAAQTSTFG